MVINIKNLMILKIIALFSLQVSAFDLQTLGGVRYLDHNNLIGAERGSGEEYGVRSHFYIDPQGEYVGLGLYYGQATYYFDETAGNAIATTTAEGDFNGQIYGPSVMVRIPWVYVQPYAQFSYVIGEYTYELKKASDFVESSLRSQISSEIKNEVRGIRSTIGIRYGGMFGFFAEYNESRETLIVKSITAKTVSFIDGEAQPIDQADSDFEESLQDLIGQRFDHVTRGFFFGADVRF